jgi:hypothetical protein
MMMMEILGDNWVNGLTLAASLIAVFFSLWSFAKTRRDSLYQDIDALYLEVLRLGIEYPGFRNPQKTRHYKEKFNDDERHGYETYAYLVWNICETIADRREDKELFNTWCPVVVAEDRLHGTWLDDADNHHCFKPEFVDFVHKEIRKKSAVLTH